MERAASGGATRTWARLCAALGVLVCLAGPGRALAQEEIPAEIYVILASEAAGTIDARLSGMPQLRRGPFAGYGTMSVLSLHTATLAVGVAHDEGLPNGRVLRVVVEGAAEAGRYRVRVAINRPGETDYLPLLTVHASPGDPFFVAGQRHGDGTLIIAIQLGTGPGAGGSSVAPSAEAPVVPEAPAAEPMLAPLESCCAASEPVAGDGTR